MPAGQINWLLDLWASTLAKHNDKPPFADHCDLYEVIDSSPFGDVKWQCFTVAYDGERPDNPKPWMDDKYDVWFHDPCEVARNMLANPTYANEFDYRPYREYSSENDQWQWKDFMSGNWAWDQADEIAKDPSTLGSTFVPIILGSDKTTVSVGTGNNEYYPLYASIGNIHNNVRRAHRNGTGDHRILNPLKPAMTTPEVTHFGDRHYRWVIYGLGPYIADYKEQVLLTCIIRGRCPKCMAPRANLDQDVLCRCHDYVEALIEEGPLGDMFNVAGIVPKLVPFTNDFPRANIYQMISPDILHQLVKGAFKDHLVEWGRGFKQWTGDDSKALMKVYLPAIEGHLPTDIVCAFHALLEFCYLVRRNIITDDALVEIEDALSRFHCYHELFKTSGAIPTFSLPRQHSLKHYIQNIQLFAASNSLCSSITENKHIKAVKEPWRRSSCYRALSQMLLINQRLDKLSAARVDFTILTFWTEGEKRAQTVPALAEELGIPRLPNLLGRFLFEQLHSNNPRDPSDIPITEYPLYLGKISVFNSASSRFYAPSDLSGIGGMHVEHICSCPSWRNEHLRHDCVFVNTDSSLPGMQGLEVARVCAFFSFRYRGEIYPCVVICWFDKVGNAADEDTGIDEHAIIHVNAIYRAAHLIPVYGTDFLPLGLKYYDLYDAF
ncbi:hypothetical protein DFH29DRAFT_986097 [Suillus ampliporus]|nr:hypothetical protein DFH29DRAFT_986097 [Suillus ampliporus]